MNANEILLGNIIVGWQYAHVRKDIIEARFRQAAGLGQKIAKMIMAGYSKSEMCAALNMTFGDFDAFYRFMADEVAKVAANPDSKLKKSARYYDPPYISAIFATLSSGDKSRIAGLSKTLGYTSERLIEMCDSGEIYAREEEMTRKMKASFA